MHWVALVVAVAEKFVRVQIRVLLGIVINGSRRRHLEPSLVINKTAFKTNTLVQALLILSILNHIKEALYVVWLISTWWGRHITIKIELVSVRLSLSIVATRAIERMVHLVHQVWETELFVTRVIFLIIVLAHLSQSLSKLIHLPFQIAVSIISTKCLEAVVSVPAHHISQSV